MRCCHGSSILKGMFYWNLDFAYFVELIGLWCLGSRIFVTLRNSQTVTSSMTSYTSKGKLQNLANDVITVIYFWLSEFFVFCFCFFKYILDNIFWNSLKIYTKLITIGMYCVPLPQFFFSFQISLNPMFHCNTRHSYDGNGLKYRVCCLTYWSSIFNQKYLAVLVFCTKIRRKF